MWFTLYYKVTDSLPIGFVQNYLTLPRFRTQVTAVTQDKALILTDQLITDPLITNSLEQPPGICYRPIPMLTMLWVTSLTGRACRPRGARPGGVA